MIRSIRRFAAAVAIVGLVAANGFASAPPDDKGQDPRWPTTGSSSKGKKLRKNCSGKALPEDHGKYSASANVANGMITGMNVRHADKRSVAITKYKTTKNMADGATSGLHFAPCFLAQCQLSGRIWIGYGYIDDWGDEYVYWFPYDRIYDGDAGAIEYYPAY